MKVKNRPHRVKCLTEGDIRWVRSQKSIEVPESCALSIESPTSSVSPIYTTVPWKVLTSPFSMRCWSIVVHMTIEGVSLIFCKDDSCTSSKTINIAVGIKGSSGVEKGREWKMQVHGKNCAVPVVNFCPNHELIQQKHRIILDGALTITCEMKVLDTDRDIHPYRDAFTQTDGQYRRSDTVNGGSDTLDKQDTSTRTDADTEVTRVTIDEKLSEKQGIERVVEDMGKLLYSGKKSDITVQVKEAEFKVHSTILSARSQVLSAMLEHDTAEWASNKICIDDCEPNVFQQYLRYLYTGSVPALTEKTVFSLYRVADKYLADDLKLMCLEHIRNTFCVETFCDAVKLSLSHAEDDLLQLAIDFACKNFQSIVISVEWQNFIAECPREANEILVKCFGPR